MRRLRCSSKLIHLKSDRVQGADIFQFSHAVTDNHFEKERWAGIQVVGGVEIQSMRSIANFMRKFGFSIIVVVLAIIRFSYFHCCRFSITNFVSVFHNLLLTLKPK